MSIKVMNMEGKRAFCLFTNRKTLVDALSNEQAGMLFKHLYSYVNDEFDDETEDILEDPVVKVVWLSFKTDLKDELVKWKKRCETNKENIRKRWNKDDTTDTNGKNGIRNDTKNTDIDIDIDIDRDIDIKKENISVNTNTKERDIQNDTNATILNEIETMFEEFWKAYPKKINKKGCLSKFKNIKGIKKEFPNIMQTLQNFKSSKQWQNIQYIPHPQTWLNQERWKDEIQEETIKNNWNNIDMTGW